MGRWARGDPGGTCGVTGRTTSVMTRSTRRAAGILALLALAFSFGESVWASTCAAMSPMARAAEVGRMSSGAPEGIHCPGFQGGDSAPAEQEGPCPFSSAVAAQLCSGLASLPARDLSLPAGSSEGAAELITVDVRSDLLLAASLFRPPRA